MEFIKIHHSQVPVLGLGTWELRREKCRNAVLSALDMGYRHVDTAQMYDNEEFIGQALEQTKIPREEIFITTKLKPPRLHYNQVMDSFKTSLDKLNTDYVDLLLIHWPSVSVPIPETIHALNKLQSDQTVKHIGVSNFSIKQTQKAMEASETPLFTNQVHYDPFRDQSSLLDFCVQNNLMLTAYSPLDKGHATSNSLLQRIGEKHHKTAAQVALRWLTQQKNVSAIPKSGDPEHQKENLDIFDFKLSHQDMEKIFELQGGIPEKLRFLMGNLRDLIKG